MNTRGEFDRNPLRLSDPTLAGHSVTRRFGSLMSSTRKRAGKGFTLTELMIVLVIAAIIAALAYPAYIQYLREAKRGEVQQLLMGWSVNQETYRANNPTYADEDELAPPIHDDYTLTVGDVTAATYTLGASAAGDQAHDTDGGVSCAVLTIDQNGQRSPIECWGGSS